MRQNTLVALVVAGVASAASAHGQQTSTPPQAASTQRPAGNVENGKRLYTAYGCYECHGREAQGAITGPRLGPAVIPLAGFTRALRTPRDQMPPYTDKVLSPDELNDIYAFVQSRSRPAAVDTVVPKP